MTRHPSPRLRAYILIGATWLLVGAAFGRPEPIILATPLLVAALAGLLLGKEPEVEVDLSLSRDRVLEGESVDLDVRLGAARSVPWLELALALPPAVATAEPAAVRGLTLEPDSGVRLSIPILAQRWGAHRVGPAVLRMRDELGFFAFERALDPGPILRVFPRSEEVRRAIPIGQTNASFGNQVSRASGDGIEFATARAYRPGDSVRRVNWRLSNRKSELHVNEMHPERSTDVVVLLDTFTDVVTPAGSSSLAAAIRGAHGIADHFLRRRDRVGLITFGATTRWLVPGMGLRQSYRLVDALLDAQAAVSFAWKGVDLIPPGSLPPRALVVALSPLVDERAVGALFDLRRRRFDVAIIEVDPEGFTELPTDPLASQALRLWRLQRAMRRDEFRSIGVAVARWAAPEPLEAALEEVRAFRRTGRLVSA